MKRKDLATQQKEWLGDAKLLFAARKHLIETYPTTPLKVLNKCLSFITSDKFLNEVFDDWMNHSKVNLAALKAVPVLDAWNAKASHIEWMLSHWSIEDICLVMRPAFNSQSEIIEQRIKMLAQHNPVKV